MIPETISAIKAAVAALVIAQPGPLPPASVPGYPNEAVRQSNIKETICKPDWTATIRPPSDYTEALKKQQLAHAKDQKSGDYEEDHLISLELGGHPRDPRNLWPQPYAGKCGARIKDHLEDTLHKMVCDGDIKLGEAQKEISSDWIKAYKKYVDAKGCK